GGRLKVDCIAGAQNGFGSHGVGESDTRHELLLACIPQIARQAVDPGEGQTATRVELAGRNLRDWVLRVVLKRLSGDRAHTRGIKALNAAVVMLGERRRQLITQAQAEDEHARQSPVVLRGEGPVPGLLGEVVVDGEAPTAGKTVEETRKTLPDRSSRRDVGRAIGPGGIEGVEAGRVAEVVSVLLIDATRDAGANGVPPDDIG